MFIIQLLNDKIHDYVVFDIIVYFITQKLKNKDTFLKNIQTEKAEEPLILTERKETKTRYFLPELTTRTHATGAPKAHIKPLLKSSQQLKKRREINVIF